MHIPNSAHASCCALSVQVIQLLAEASQRIQPNVGELFPALKVRPRYSPRGCHAAAPRIPPAA